MSFRRLVPLRVAPSLSCRAFGRSPILLAADPEELERERQLREKLIKNPSAMFGQGQAQAQGNSSAAAGSDNSQSPQSANTGTPPRSDGRPKGFWEQFQQFHEMRNASRAAQTAAGGSATGSPSFFASSTSGSGERPGPMKIIASLIMMYATFKLLFRAQGQDLSHTVIPYWVSSYETQAKYLLMTFVMDPQVRAVHEARFAQARRAQPLLTFFDYLDQADPNWCNGLRTPRDRVVNTLTGALCALSPWQVVSLANRLNYNLQGSRASTAEKVDVVFETTSAHLGGPRAMMANLIGGSGNGNIPVLRLSGAQGQGPMTISDGAGHTIPVQPLSHLHPVVLHQSSRPISPEMLPPGFAPPGGAPIATPVVPPFSPVMVTGGIPASYTTQSSSGTRVGEGMVFGDTVDSERGAHGTIPVFK